MGPRALVSLCNAIAGSLLKSLGDSGKHATTKELVSTAMPAQIRRALAGSIGLKLLHLQDSRAKAGSSERAFDYCRSGSR